MDERIDELITNASELQAQLVDMAVVYGTNVVAALLILIAGSVAAGWAHRRIAWLLHRTGRLDATLEQFLSGLVRYAILAVTFLIVLSQFGVQTASLLAILASAGLALGLALQGTLSHVAAGVMLLFLRPIRVGEYVDAGGIAGTVEAVDLFTTEMRTADGVLQMVPNGRIWGQVVMNYSRSTRRRADITVGIDYGADIDAALQTMKRILSTDTRVLAEPAPIVFVSGLQDSAVAVTARFWTGSGDFFQAQWELTKAIKEAFDRDGIGIPFPTRTVIHAGGPPAG